MAFSGQNTQQHVAVLALVAIAVLVGINYSGTPKNCIQGNYPRSECFENIVAIAKTPRPLVSTQTIMLQTSASN